MMRLDAAGNISKRFAAGAVPVLALRRRLSALERPRPASSTPGRIVTQVIETPDSERYFTLSRTVRRVVGLQAGLEDELVVGLGCELKYAGKLVQARGLDMANPITIEIGPSCRICERPACPQRAAAPINRTLLVEGEQQGPLAVSRFARCRRPG